MDNGLYSIFYLKDEDEFLECTKPVEAFIYYKEFKIDLLTSEKILTPITELCDELATIELGKTFEKPIVFHFFYEFGYLFQDQLDSISTSEPLAIKIRYLKHSQSSITMKPDKVTFKLVEYPKLKNYKIKYNKVFDHLLNGDCYQVNLTHPFFFKTKVKLEDKDFLRLFVNSKERLGAYAHYTSIGCMDKAYLSNSPECLFKAFNTGEELTIRSMPIKGTIEDKGIGSWGELKNSLKDQGELYMITDLIRNDLSKIKLTPSRVIKRKAPLRVPGIVHQFSVVDTTVEKETTLLNVMEALFPGGSITGAPKKRVMEIIKDIEKYPRGFYCGSTVLLHKSLKCASINIRSAEISLDKAEIKYGSGGGVTLLSKCESEFKETFQKMESFIKFLDVEIVSND